MTTCMEAFGNKVDAAVSGGFRRLGSFVGSRPRTVIALCFVLALACGAGFATWETESRGDELWVPQDTEADREEEAYLEHYPSTARFNQLMIVQNGGGDANVLAKENLMSALKIHQEIVTRKVDVPDEGTFDFLGLCAPSGGSSCATSTDGVCQCLVTSILRQWNYDADTLRNDTDYISTLSGYGTREDLEAVLGRPVFDEDGQLVSAEAFTINYFLKDRTVVEDGSESDPINEAWEGEVFLDVAEAAAEAQDTTAIQVEYFASRSFSDEFGAAITGDLTLVQVSYFVAFLFLGATMGRIRCGTGSRWTMALAALVMVVLAIVAGFGVSSLFGLFYGPIHSLLPFVLLGIGVDDAFVIVNAFDRERKVPRVQEDNDGIMERCARSLSRAGASITVTSLTDLVAFGISASSALPALASFCAYAAICIFFLWLFASTFFTACLVLDERRQRDNRRECVCCLTRNGELREEGDKLEEGLISRYFRKYHAPTILSTPGKIVIMAVFAGLLGFGVYGAMNLTVEDSGRSFIPQDSYIADWIETGDEYFPSQGTDVYVIFENGNEMYESRQDLSQLDNRISGLSDKPPYLSEPVSEEAYRNVMDGFGQYLQSNGTGAIGGAALGSDGWPTTQADFVSTLSQYASFGAPGAMYAQDIVYTDDSRTELKAMRVKLQYVKLVTTRRGEQINDADKLIDAMDSTRVLIQDWEDLPPSFAYSDYFLTIEGFKIIRRELFQNVGLAIVAVGVIVFFTVASPVTSLLITLNVAFCIIEILGFMFVLGIVIDNVSVINIVLAVGLSVDYSAHVGHCFMTKKSSDRNKRVTESLADIGAAVLSGATSTFLAVVVLLFSSSYVFTTLSKQFALTVGLGLLHGLVALPVMLSICGPKPYSSAEDEDTGNDDKALAETDHQSFHPACGNSSSSCSNIGAKDDVEGAN